MTEKPIQENTLLETIWLKPTQTLKFILERCPNKYLTGLFILGGISRAIDRASSRNMGNNLETWAVLTISILIGSIFGWIGFYIYAWAMSETGKWLNGKAGSDKFRTVLGWSTVPIVVSLFLLIPQLIIIGDDLFRSEVANNNLFVGISYLVFGAIELTLSIWSLVILVKGIAIIQKFSIGNAILNMLLPTLIIAIPILLLLLIL